GTRFLSTEILECDPNGQNCALDRSTYLRYAYEEPCGQVQQIECDDSNRRVASQRTVYHEDAGDRIADVTYSDFDGLGHYRATTTGGTFPGNNLRTTHTEFNPGHDLVLGGSHGTTVQGGYVMWPSGDPWVLGTFTEATVAEGGDTAKTQACFDSSTGFLKRSRGLEGTTPGSDDLITRHNHDGLGNVVVERHYGGDSQPVSTSSNLCALSLPAEPAYRKVHDYVCGSLVRSRYAIPDSTSTGVQFYNVDVTFEASTGHPPACSGIAGIET
ncbi:MAG: hypothetical protein GY708_07985, partial [Actinomycetia bacterium]|nr:hypothetical protein [Actinomycetes bacterium]